MSKKTLNKWLTLFAPRFANQLKGDRQLSQEEVEKIYQILGNPNDNPILSKLEIAQQCESNTKTLRENIALMPKQYGFKSVEQYDSLGKIPPKICQQVIAIFNGDICEKFSCEKDFFKKT